MRKITHFYGEALMNICAARYNRSVFLRAGDCFSRLFSLQEVFQ